jgi:hypothetical protein
MGYLLILLLIMVSPAWAVTTFGQSTVLGEVRRQIGTEQGPFVRSGCLPVVPSSSLTLDAFACTAVVKDADNANVPVIQSAVSLVLPNSATVWIALDVNDIGVAPSGWTRETGKRTHYIYQANATRPADPVGGIVVGRATIAGSVITAIALDGPRLIADTVTLITDTTFLVTSALRFVAGGLLAHGTTLLTINGPFAVDPDAGQLFSGTGRVVLGVRSVPVVSVLWFGAVGDNSTDNCIALTKAVAAVAERVNLGTDVFAALYWPGMHDFVSSCGIPLTRRVAWYSEPGYRGAKLRNTGTGSAVYTATYSAGTFTDNLDQNITQVLAGTDAAGSSLTNILIEQTGTIAGNAPSGTAWDAIMHLNGFYDAKLVHVRVDGTAGANIDGVRIRNGFRHLLDHVYAVRGSAVTGGVGINVLEQNNAGTAVAPSVQGPWATSFAVDRNIDVTNGYALFNPRLEGAVTGNGWAFDCQATGVAMIGGYIEGNQTAFNLGTVGGTACIGPVITGVFIGTDGNTVAFANLNNVQNGIIDFQPQPSYTVSTDEFVSATGAQGNEGNVIRWRGDNADVVTPASLGLNQGDNTLEVIGKGTGLDVYQRYLTSATSTLLRMSRHFDALVVEDNVRIGAVSQASLGTPAAGTIRWCSDCTVTDGSNNTCAASGSGAFALRVGSVWRCFALQN